MENQIKEIKKPKRKGNIINIILVVILFITFFIFIAVFVRVTESAFNKYCHKEHEGLYVCNIPGHDYKIEETVRSECSLMGFGYFGGVRNSKQYCYNFPDENKKCRSGEDCSSHDCIADDINCKDNCFGKCWGNIIPLGMGQSGGCIDRFYYSVENGKVIKNRCYVASIYCEYANDFEEFRRCW